MNTPNPLCQTETDTQVAPKAASVEQRVIRQLLEAVLFEGVIEYHYQQGEFTFELEKRHYRARGQIRDFGRIRLDGESIMSRKNDDWCYPKLTTLVAALPGSDTAKQRLLHELQHTVKLCRWNQQHGTWQPNRRELSYRELESAIDEGHPYHPCFKARTGFSLDDHANYGPEQANTFQLHWLAIRRCHLKQQLPEAQDAQFWQAELGLHCRSQLLQRMMDKGADWHSHSLLPIHPWQWQQLEDALEVPLSNCDLIYLGAAGSYYQASLSVRTLINASKPSQANIKLPMNMVNSSSLRTLEPHSICTAPHLSQWLNRIVEKDPFLQQQASLELLDEYAGITLQPCDMSDDWSNHFAGQLGVIFRESVEKKIPLGMQAAPFVALSVCENDGLPFIQPWIANYGCDKWLSQLIDTAIIPVWHLLVHHGIALEAHAQNMVLVHHHGWPKKIILRDFHESLEYVEEYIANPELIPDFKAINPTYKTAKPNQYYWMESVEALRELLVDTLFVFNLSELAMLMEQHFYYPERAFWKLVHSRIHHYNQAGHTSPERIKQIALNPAQIKTESLLTRKLQDNPQGEFHHAIPNPFYGEADAHNQ